MPTTFWYSIGYYLLGIVIVLTLLFALMDSSRKYDKYHQWPYLSLATGYFFLLVWVIVRSMLLNYYLTDWLQLGCQLLGLLLLAIGYTAEHMVEQPLPTEKSVPHVPPLHHADLLHAKHEDKVSQPTKEAANEPKLEKKEQLTAHNKKDLPDWAAKLVAADENQPKITRREEDEPAKVTKPAVVESHLPGETAGKKTDLPAKKKGSTTATDTVDLSYLSAKTKKAKSQPEIAATPNKSKPANEEQPAQSRAEMMDDLFPIAKVTSDDTPLAASATESETKVSERPKAAKKDPIAPMAIEKKAPATVKTKAKDMPIALLLAPAGFDLSSHWHIYLTLFLLLVIIFQLLRHHKNKAHSLLAAGFVVVLASSVLNLFSESIKGLFGLNNPSTIVLVTLVEAVGFSLVGLACWQRIKGKVTHHFLTVVSLTYLVIALLTVGLATVIVRDDTSLQLLLLFSSGSLIALLPIIHSFAYNHPAQNASDKGIND